MKLNRSTQRNHAMTLIEAAVVIFVIGFLVMLLLPALYSNRHYHHGPSCANNLKQLNLSYLLWAGDNHDKLPMEVSVTNGGTMELMNTSDAWKVFQVMSNELSTPKVIYCPEDTLRGNAATNFGDDLKNKISYFIGMDAIASSAKSVLDGDDNLLINGSPVSGGLVVVASNSPVAWNDNRHVSLDTHAWIFKTKTSYGYIGLGDGSVLPLKNSELVNQLRQTSLATNRLVIP